MFLRLYLCLLYTLQLVVLSEMVAAYLNIIPNTKSPPPPQQTAPPTPQTAPSPYQTAPASQSLLHKTAPENIQPELRHNKQSVRLKPVSLTYLREHLPRVSSRLDLVRLFTDTDDDGANLDRWVSRTLQSVSDTRNDWPHQERGRLKEKSQTTRLPEIIRFDKLSDDPASESFESMDENAARVKDIINEGSDEVVADKTAEDSDYFMEYSPEESVDGDLEAFEAALHHMEETSTCSSCRCRQPTSFVFRVRDLQDDTRVFLPECVVLHRCLNYSGCCGDSSHECVPKSMNAIYKAFLVVDRLVAGEEFVTFHPNMATTISFVNHTECECREKPKLPVCTKTCPTPLRLTREGVDCVCDCFPQANLHSYPCDSVRDGVARLSQDGLMCIRNGNCYNPRCSVGEFDINTGFCPLSDEFALPAFLFSNPNDRRFYRSHLQSFDFSNLPERITSTSPGWTISPTPSSSRREFAYSQHYTIESLTSRSVPTYSAPIRSSHEAVDLLENRINASIYSARNSLNVSEQTASDKNNFVLVYNETGLNFSKSNTRENTSVNDFQSWYSTSFREEDHIRSSDDIFYGDVGAKSSENHGESESSSRVEDDSTGNSQFLNGDSSNIKYVSADARFPIEIVYDDNDASNEMESPHYETEDSDSNPLNDGADEPVTSSPRMNKHATISHTLTLSSSDQTGETFSRQTPIITNTHRSFKTSANFHERFIDGRARIGAHSQAYDIHSNSKLDQAPTTASSLSSSSSPLPLAVKLFSSSVTSSTSNFQLPSTSPSTSQMSPSLLPKSSSSLSSTSSTDSLKTPVPIPHNTLPSDTSRDNDAISGSVGETPAQHPP